MGWLPWSSSSPSSDSNNAPTTSASPSSSSLPPNHPSPADQSGEDKCPVDHETRSRWLAENKNRDPSSSAPKTDHDEKRALHPFLPALRPKLKAPTPQEVRPEDLSKERVISSIPRWTDASSSSTSSYPATQEVPSNSATDSTPKTQSESGNWVYPSPSQFYTALERKARSPSAGDMPVVVPIHNAVNERVWEEILGWEKERVGLNGQQGEQMGSRSVAVAGDAERMLRDVKLVSFKGRPNDRSPRAWFNVLLGYQAPFDRHDWLIDRGPNQPRMRYVIDFYSGRSSSLPASVSHRQQQGTPSNLSFYLDVRPALDGAEGAKMRFGRVWNKWFGFESGSRQGDELSKRGVPSGQANR